MKLLGNIIWFVFGGVFLALQYVVAGLLMCCTIIGIPFGWQIFKIAGLALWPFGRVVRNKQQTTGCLSTGMNLLWILIGGIWLALEHAIAGLIFCITIIGIPFGKQHFKLAAIALTPFGKEIVSANNAKNNDAEAQADATPSAEIAPSAAETTEDTTGNADHE